MHTNTLGVGLGYMKEKPFYNMFPVLYWHQRNKYNPLRYIIGKRYLSKKVPHNLFDTRDITIEPTGDNVKDYIAKKIAVKHINNYFDKI